MKHETVYDLRPTDGRKSCGGKAQVYERSDGSRVLYSYGTPILTETANGELIRLWHGWSTTTGRHIKYFCGLSKSEFLKLPAPAELSPAEKAAAYSGTLYR